MKKLIAIILLVCLCAALAGCGEKVEVTAAQPSATAVATVAPTIAPTATPIPIVNPGDYVLQWKNDADRGINYMIPTHWEVESYGERFITYLEPVPDGESCFRVCLVNKKKASEPDSNKMKVEFKSLMAEMGKVYADFSWDGTISREYKLVKFTGYHSEYTFTDDNGTPMHGFVITATYNRRIYCMNFQGPEERWNDMKSVMIKMMDNLTRIA